MSNSQEVAILIRYELARQKVDELTKKRAELIEGCKHVIDTNDRLARGDYSAPYVTCLNLAYDEMNDLKKCGEDACYWEVLNGLDEDDYCENCKAAYALKVGRLAQARKEFGAAKRSISAIGKRLMKEAKL